MWRSIPVVFIFYQGQMIAGLTVGCNVWTCSGYDSIIKSCIYIDDTAIWISKVIQKCRLWLGCVDRKHLTVCFHRINLCIGCRTVMVCQQMLQTLFHCLGIHRSAT